MEVAMYKNCTRLWRKAHLQVKMHKTPQGRSHFGSCDVQKLHAAVAKSTFASENVKKLTGSDHFSEVWIQLPVEQYLAALPTLKQGVIAGVFRQKGAAPWGITRAEKLQLSVFLPNDLSLEDWYAGVYGLPTVWPEVSMMGAMTFIT